MRNPGVTHPGCYAEDVIVPHDGLVACPPDLRPEVAAAMPIAFGTAWHMLVPLAQAQSGETVLILGASGGVGVATTVVATALGLPVVAVVGGREKEPHLKVLGASHTIALDGADLIDEVRRCTARRGVDIVIDLVGGPTFRQALACVATGGRLVTAGAHAGEVVDVDLVEIFRREIRVLGSRGHTREDLDAVMALLDLTSLRPIVRDVLPLESAAEAHQRLAARLGVGKLVLSIS
jgi:NADPH2:quinone reductase